MTDPLPTIIDHPGRNVMVQIDIERLTDGLFIFDIETASRGSTDAMITADVTRDCLAKVRDRINELLEQTP